MDAPPIKPKNGYNIIYGTRVVPVFGLDEVVDYLIDVRASATKFEARARTSLTQERKLTGPESAYVVAKASERIKESR